MPKIKNMDSKKLKKQSKSQIQQKLKTSRNNKASPLKKQAKKNQKSAKKKHLIKLAPAVSTIFFLILIFLFYLCTMILSPKFTIPAKISVVKGGYELTYKICEVPLGTLPENIEIGDKFYIDTFGRYQKTPRNGMQVKVTSIDEKKGIAYTKFTADDVPYFITTEEYKEAYKGDSINKIIDTVYITGKFAFKRFNLYEITV